MSKILAAALAACIVVLTSQPGEARRFRMPAAFKPSAAVAPKPVPPAPAQRPVPAARPAAGGVVFFPIVRPAAAATRPPSEQRAISEPVNAYSGPAQFSWPPADEAAAAAKDTARPEPEAPARPKAVEPAKRQPLVVVAGANYPVSPQAQAGPPAPTGKPVYCFVQASGGCKPAPY